MVFGDNELKCSNYYNRKAGRAYRTSKNAVIAKGRTEGKLQMKFSPGKNGLTSLFKEVRLFKA